MKIFIELFQKNDEEGLQFHSSSD